MFSYSVVQSFCISLYIFFLFFWDAFTHHSDVEDVLRRTNTERGEQQKGVLTGIVLSLFLFLLQPSGAPVENDPLGPLPPGWGKCASHIYW